MNVSEPREPSGVRYARSDYVCLWRRGGIAILDVTLVLIATLVTYVAVGLAVGLETEAQIGATLFASGLALGLLYMVILKRTRFRILGYHAFGARIVDLSGKPPSLWQMLLRFAFVLLGPWNFLLDLVDSWDEDACQTSRDKIAGTYVVRWNAIPVAEGKIAYVYRRLLGGRVLLKKELTRPPVGGET